MSPRFAVDERAVLLELLREALTDATVRASIPDGVPKLVPLVVVRRISGTSLAPRFWDGPLVNVQTWAAEDLDAGIDAVTAASDLADRVRRVLWEAWDNQTVTTAGHIGRLRESQAPMEIPDVDLPFLGRFTATYELRIRPVAA
jgi:hypothetical protein